MRTGCDEVTRISAGDSATGSDIITGRWKDGRVGTVRTPASFRRMVKQIVAFFQSGNPPVPNEETLEIFAFMDAAQPSKEAGGKPMKMR